MTTRDDYGGGAEGTSQLVPSGLRVYRHYKVSEKWLTATITCQSPVKKGVNVARCYSWGSLGPDPSCMMCAGSGAVRKLRIPDPGIVDFFDVSPIVQGWDTYVDHCECVTNSHNSPERSCTCGFYASYDPAYNFFRTEFGATSRWKYDLPGVFAVVEATGRVLMGSKGVRAEKMEVKAISLDMDHLRYRLHTPDQFADARRELGRVAEFYDVPAYKYTYDMIGDFPQPDLSHLIENQEKPNG